MNPQPTEQQTKEILDRLEELHKKATQGPIGVPDRGTRVGILVSKGGPISDWKGMVASFDAGDYACSASEGLANADLYVEMHNNLLLLLSLSSRTLTAEAELQKAQRESEEALQHAKAMAENAALWSELLDDAKATITSLRLTVARMEGLIEKLFASATPNPNDHPTMYVAWAEAGDFLNERNAALQPAQSTPPLAQTAMDWDERLPYVPEKKTEGLPAQSAAKVEELSEQKHVRVCVHGISEHRYCPTCSPWKRSWDSLDDRQPTPPQEQKTGGGEAYEKEWIELNAAYNWLWQNCRIVFWPKAPDYPIEHNPHARKESRGLIEYHMTKALGQANHPTQPEVETVGWKDICTAPDVKGQYFFCRLAWGPDDDKTTADGFRWNGRWFAAPTFHAERSADGCQIQMRQVEVYPSHWMPEPAAPLSTQSPQPKEEQSHEA